MNENERNVLCALILLCIDIFNYKTTILNLNMEFSSNQELQDFLTNALNKEQPLCEVQIILPTNNDEDHYVRITLNQEFQQSEVSNEFELPFNYTTYYDGTFIKDQYDLLDNICASVVENILNLKRGTIQEFFNFYLEDWLVEPEQMEYLGTQQIWKSATEHAITEQLSFDFKLDNDDYDVDELLIKSNTYENFIPECNITLDGTLHITSATININGQKADGEWHVLGSETIQYSEITYQQIKEATTKIINDINEKMELDCNNTTQYTP